ncbi:hypothetical protein [Streptomyces sp. CB02923]|uniref:hypothetical protein n=1 Tax=Streptomyces sp. CB02923 TaxID=1718985 RepID=UPI00093C5A84|nr:hypothetical protein [Streptomyces sp. CB02923]
MANNGEREDVCRVCGYSDGTVFREGGRPTSATCRCCGAQAGLQDTDLEQVWEVRGYWVGTGAEWLDPECRPEGWDLLRQVAGIPPGWR